MAIKILRQGLPVLGQAKIGMQGAPRGDGKQSHPVKFDHIELTTLDRNEDGQLVPDFELLEQLLIGSDLFPAAPTCGGCARSAQLAKITGNDLFLNGLPTAIMVGLPYNDIELVFPNRFAYYRGRTVFCSGDGEDAKRLDVSGTGDKAVYGPAKPWAGAGSPGINVCGPGCPDFDAQPTPRCKPTARLSFLLPGQPNVGGVYQFKTTSWNSVANIQRGLEFLHRVTGGAIAWIPLTFEIKKQTVQPRSGKANSQQIARLYFNDTTDALFSQVKLQLEARAPMIQQIHLLEASLSKEWTMTPEEVEEFRAEFDHEALAGEALPTAAAAETAAPTSAQGPGGGEQQEAGGTETESSATGAVEQPGLPEPPPAVSAPPEPDPMVEQQRSEFVKAVRERCAKAGREKNDVAYAQKCLKKHGFEHSRDVPSEMWPRVIQEARSGVVPK